MPWYLFEPEKKYPFAAPEPDDAGDFRYPAAIFFWLAGGVGVVGAFVAVLFGSVVVSGWLLALGFASLALAWAVVPSDRRKRK